MLINGRSDEVIGLSGINPLSGFFRKASMPFTRIGMPAGKTPEHRAAVADAVQEALHADLGVTLDEERITAYVAGSVMLVTALSPAICHQNAAHIAEQAMRGGSTLKEIALKSGEVDEATYDKVVDSKKMVGHGVSGA